MSWDLYDLICNLKSVIKILLLVAVILALVIGIKYILQTYLPEIELSNLWRWMIPFMK